MPKKEKIVRGGLLIVRILFTVTLCRCCTEGGGAIQNPASITYTDRARAGTTRSRPEKNHLPVLPLASQSCWWSYFKLGSIKDILRPNWWRDRAIAWSCPSIWNRSGKILICSFSKLFSQLFSQLSWCINNNLFAIINPNGLSFAHHENENQVASEARQHINSSCFGSSSLPFSHLQVFLGLKPFTIYKGNVVQY